MECVIDPNPDIIGIGIRISIYILSLAGPLISVLALSPELHNSISSSLGVTGLALIITTFIYAGRHSLDLFHAICLFHLVGLVGVSVSPKKRATEGNTNKYAEQTSARRLVGACFYYIGLGGLLSFMVYVFVTSATFGSTPECNGDVKYVLFAVDIQATNYVFRGIFLFSLCSGLLGLLISIIFIFRMIDAESEKINLYRIIGDLAGRSYIIAMLELIIRHNTLGPGLGEWTFGQLLAMMMLVGPIVELASWKMEDINFDDPFVKTSDEIFVNYVVHISLSILDLAGNAAAGATAAAVGAHVNGNPITSEILRLGTVGGVLKAGVLGFATLVSASSGATIANLLSVVLSTFGMSFIVTSWLAQQALPRTPDELLIAAVAAGAPMLAGGAFQDPTVVSAGLLPLSVGWDALTGYTFARVASNHGYEVCTLNAAAAAGACFGVVMIVWKLPYALCLSALKDRRESYN